MQSTHFRAVQTFGASVLLVFTYQNCNSGFKPVTPSGDSASLLSNPHPDPTPDPPATMAMHISGTELVPIQVQLSPQQVYKSLTVDNFPSGMSYDTKKNVILWLPSRGQAGTYQVNVHAQSASGTSTKYVEFEIAPVSDDTLAQGPPDYLHDGDVGYVFVHGAGGTDDRCKLPDDLAAYWGATPEVISPDDTNRLLACYDGRLEVPTTAPGVAQQIVNASCGKYQKCVIITHSMGGLMLEHIFTHSDPASGGSWQLYRQAQTKTLYVISLSSAAGGSKTADLVNGHSSSNTFQAISGGLAKFFGEDDASTRGLGVSNASHVVAPLTSDPAIAFYMVPGFSPRRLADAGGLSNGIFTFLTGQKIPGDVFEGNKELAVVDDVTQFHSRSDGLVSFRSSCGVASDTDDDGPGVSATVDAQMQYCYTSSKKPHHYVWFMTNLNHFLVPAPWSGCWDTWNPCRTYRADPTNQTFAEDANLRNLHPSQVIRQGIIANHSNFQSSPIYLAVDW